MYSYILSTDWLHDCFVVATASDDTASDDAENRGLIIGIPLAVLIVLILLVVIFIVIRVMSTRRSGLNILKYPPPPCE